MRRFWDWFRRNVIHRIFDWFDRQPLYRQTYIAFLITAGFILII